MPMTTEKRREYMRKWRAANKDKIKQYQIRHWRKKAKEDRLARKARAEG